MVRTPELDPGDTVEFAVTMQFSPSPGLNIWVKGGGSTTVRPDETGSRAFRRLAKFIEKHLEKKVDEINDSAG